MFRTCTVQVNLDFESEADMVKKFRVGLALQPIATALFANSPFREGRPNGFLSYRAQIWTDVDNARAGMLPWVFEDGMGVRALCRLRARCADVFRLSRRQIYRRGGQELPRFPRPQDSRSRAYRRPCSATGPIISPRSSRKCGSRASWRCAAPMAASGGASAACRRCGSAFSMTPVALDAAWDLVKDWTAEERQAMRDGVGKLGLQDAVPQHHGARHWRIACWRSRRRASSVAPRWTAAA